METLKDICVHAIAEHPENYDSFVHLPSSLTMTLFDKMRCLGTLRTNSAKSPMGLFRGTDIPTLSLSSLSSSTAPPMQRADFAFRIDKQRQCGSAKDRPESYTRPEYVHSKQCYPIDDSLFHFVDGIESDKVVQGLDAKGFSNLQSIEFLYCEGISEQFIDWMNPPSLLSSITLLGCAGINNTFLEKLCSSPLKDTLRVLNVSETPITDEGIQHLTALSKLEELYISTMPYLTKKSGPALAKLKQLRVLDIRFTPVSAPVIYQELVNLECLHALDSERAYVDYLSVIKDAEWNDYPLKTLSLECDRRHPDLFDELSKLTKLEHITLATNGLDIDVLSKLTALKFISFPNNPHTASILIANVWDNLPTSMEAIELSWMTPSRNVVHQFDELTQLGRLTNLRSLRLDGGNFQITDNVLAALRGLTNLEELFLEYSISSSGEYKKFTDEGLYNMLAAPSPFKNLRCLDISIGTLDYTHLFTSESFPSLTYLKLQGGTQYMYEAVEDPDECFLTDTTDFPESLEELHLIACRIDPKTTCNLAFLTTLHRLHTVSFYLTKAPSTLRSIKALKRSLRSLKLSITDGAPAITDEEYAEVLGELVNLRSLECSHMENVGAKTWTAVGSNLHKLQFLALEVPLHDLKPLSSISTLQVLSLKMPYEESLKKEKVKNFASPPNLEVLLSDDVQFEEEELIECIPNMPRLVCIQLKHSKQQTEKLLSTLSTLPRLKWLDFTRGNVTFKGLARLRESKSLKSVNVSCCKHVREVEVPVKLNPEEAEILLVRGVCAGDLEKFIVKPHVLDAELTPFIEKWSNEIKSHMMAVVRKMLDKAIACRSLPANEQKKEFSLAIQSEHKHFKTTYWILMKFVEKQQPTSSADVSDTDCLDFARKLVSTYLGSEGLEKTRQTFFPGIHLKDFWPEEKKEEKEEKEGDDEKVYHSVKEVFEGTNIQALD